MSVIVKHDHLFKLQFLTQSLFAGRAQILLLTSCPHQQNLTFSMVDNFVVSLLKGGLDRSVKFNWLFITKEEVEQAESHLSLA